MVVIDELRHLHHVGVGHLQHDPELILVIVSMLREGIEEGTFGGVVVQGYKCNIQHQDDKTDEKQRLPRVLMDVANEVHNAHIKIPVCKRVSRWTGPSPAVKSQTYPRQTYLRRSGQCSR